MTLKTTLSLGLLAVLSSSVNAQGTTGPAPAPAAPTPSNADTGNHVTPPPGHVDEWDMWNWTGAQSVYWVSTYFTILYAHIHTLCLSLSMSVLLHILHFFTFARCLATTTQDIQT